MTAEAPDRLLGEWVLEREIVDRRSGMRSFASGRAKLTRERQDLITWHEDVLLSYRQSELAAHRNLRVELDDMGLWQVKFEDGRPFHPWSPGDTVTHHCGADTYKGVIDLIGTADKISSWQTIWSVRGPEKDLSIRTRLRK